jgi:cytochrome c oxidase subunit 3
MPGTREIQEIEIIIEDIGGGGGTEPPAGGDGEDGDKDRRRRPEPPSARRYYTAMALGIVSILMFFMALASAFLVREAANDWIPVHMPAVIWVNTIVLLTSSATMELARKRLARGDAGGFRTLWQVTTALGIFFLAGQLVAWRQLIAQGVYIASNPASSFFYIFTAAHGLHLLGGVCALLYVLLRAFEKTSLSRALAAEVTSFYWHFMDGLWVFLLALLHLGK